MNDKQSARLERRITDLGAAMVALGDAVDENLRTILLAMTTEAVVVESLRLHDTNPLQEAVMDRALTLLALEGPVASDLRWAMAMMRLAKDYERIADLSKALMGRVVSLTDTLHEETLHAMIGVMRAILRLHAVLLGPARPAFRPKSIDWEDHARARAAVADGIDEIEHRSAEALLRGEGSPEDLRELVLATRHLQRIADQIERMPAEEERFRAAGGAA